MTPFEEAVEVVWVALVAIAVRGLRRAWKDRARLARLERIWRNFWPYSETALQGWLRAQVAISLIGFVLAAMYPVAILFRTTSGSTKLTLALIILLGVVAIVLMVGLVIAVALFNVPRFLVFPAMRDQEGVVVQWWHRRRT